MGPPNIMTELTDMNVEEVKGWDDDGDALPQRLPPSSTPSSSFEGNEEASPMDLVKDDFFRFCVLAPKSMTACSAQIMHQVLGPNYEEILAIFCILISFICFDSTTCMGGSQESEVSVWSC
jgi:hypothetical protein